jgi:hypothetical protein
MKHGQAKRPRTPSDSYDHDAWVDESPRVRTKTYVRPFALAAIRVTMICGSTKRPPAA